MRPVRLVLLIVFVLGVVGLLAGAVARTYLTSPDAAARASAVLSKTYGAPVRVGSADIDFDATTLCGVSVFEADAGPDDPPWAVARVVRADVSLWELIGGSAMPREVHLKQAQVTLRFDEAGRLLTHLPRRKSGERLPTIHITDARVTLKQIGRDDLVAHGIDAVLAPEDGELHLTGRGADPRWGVWDLGGGLDPVHGVSWLSARSTQSVTLDAETLRGLPFVSPRVWHAIRAEGESPVDLAVRYDPNVGRVQYRVALDPRKTELHIIPIDLDATEAHGRVVIENGLVTLQDVYGRTSDGELQLDGDLDFSQSPSKMEFNIKVQRVDIQKLPKKWPIPTSLVRGRLTGQANLVVSVVQGKVKTTGQGEGEVMDVPLPLGKKATFPLRLSADEHGFHFRPGLPKTTGWFTPTPAAAGAN
jgi:hypothetical protein